MAYLKKQEGSVSLTMHRLVQEIIAWSELCLDDSSARYSSGKQNIFTDHLNCPDEVLPTEKYLLSLVFSNIFREFSHLLLDLFASRANTKLSVNMYLIPGPMARKKDTF